MNGKMLMFNIWFMIYQLQMKFGQKELLLSESRAYHSPGTCTFYGTANTNQVVLEMMGLQLPYLVSGSVVVERIFGIPGMGWETFEAIRAGDHAWLTAVVTVTALLTMLGLVAADVIYALVDPRIVPGRRAGGVA